MVPLTCIEPWIFRPSFFAVALRVTAPPLCTAPVRMWAPLPRATTRRPALPRSESAPRRVTSSELEPAGRQTSHYLRTRIPRARRHACRNCRSRSLQEKATFYLISRECDWVHHLTQSPSLKSATATFDLAALCLMSLTAWTRPRRLALGPR
jgi:hypothetical protein